MLDAFFTGVTLKDIGAVALVTIFVLLGYFGKVVPKSTVDTQNAQYEARIAELISERDDWKAAHGTSEHARELQAVQVRELAELGRTVDHVIRSLQAATGIGAGAIRPDSSV
jgi:hypothetical protein